MMHTTVYKNGTNENEEMNGQSMLIKSTETTL